MASSLTPRGSTMRHLSTHRGITESPAGSNSDSRKWGIRRAQIDCAEGASWLIGTPWCGEWAFWALQHGGVKGITSRQAAVLLIQQDAKAKRAPFFDWLAPTVANCKQVLRGDLVTWFGGAHVEVVRGFKKIGGVQYVITDGGNTSSGNSGSQSNGGGSYRRVRPLSQADGFARVDFPGGKVKRAVDRLAMVAEKRGVTIEVPAPSETKAVSSSDAMLLAKLDGSTDPAAVALRAALKAAQGVTNV